MMIDEERWKQQGDIRNVMCFKIGLRGIGYIITYAAGINNYPRYLNQVEIMWATFHVKG